MRRLSYVRYRQKWLFDVFPDIEECLWFKLTLCSLLVIGALVWFALLGLNWGVVF